MHSNIPLYSLYPECSWSRNWRRCVVSSCSTRSPHRFVLLLTAIYIYICVWLGG